MGAVEEVAADAILLLVSQLKGSRMRRCLSIGGNLPKDPGSRAIIERSGFLSLFGRKRASEDSGYFRKHEGKRVRQDIAAELIRFATSRLSGVGRKNQGVYRAYIECMSASELRMVRLALPETIRDLYRFMFYLNRI